MRLFYAPVADGNVDQGIFRDCVSYAFCECMKQQVYDKHKMRLTTDKLYNFTLAHCNAFSFDNALGAVIWTHVENMIKAFNCSEGYVSSQDQLHRMQITISGLYLERDMLKMMELVKRHKSLLCFGKMQGCDNSHAMAIAGVDEGKGSLLCKNSWGAKQPIVDMVAKDPKPEDALWEGGLVFSVRIRTLVDGTGNIPFENYDTHESIEITDPSMGHVKEIETDPSMDQANVMGSDLEELSEEIDIAIALYAGPQEKPSKKVRFE